jgi:hypothetical protein
MYVSRRELSAFPSRESWDLGKPSPLESGKLGANPTSPLPTVGRNRQRDRYFANDPLSVLETLGLLERPLVFAEGEQGNHVCQRSQEVQEDQGSLPIDLRYTSRKKHPVSFIRPGSDGFG